MTYDVSVLATIVSENEDYCMSFCCMCKNFMTTLNKVIRLQFYRSSALIRMCNAVLCFVNYCLSEYYC